MSWRSPPAPCLDRVFERPEQTAQRPLLSAPGSLVFSGGGEEVPAGPGSAWSPLTGTVKQTNKKGS